MRKGAAFRFFGSISSSVMFASANVSSGNVVYACIDAGIALIDMTSSIIACMSEFERTRILSDQMSDRKKGLNRVLQIEKEQSEEAIKRAKEILLKQLEQKKLELNQQYEIMRKHTEAEILAFKNTLELDQKRTAIITKVRLMSQDAINIAKDALDELNKNPVANSINIANLQEQLRLAVAQYSKLVKIYC